MGLKISGYVTVWNAYQKDYVLEESTNYADASFSTSRKDSRTGKYETDLSGKLRFVGSGLEKVRSANLQHKDKLNILAGSMNTYKGSNGVTYNNFLVFDFEIPETSGEQKPRNIEKVETELVPIDSSDLPF